MSTRQKRNTGLGKLVVPVFSILLSSYFVYHAQIGRYGWEAQKEMEERAIDLDYRLAAYRIERDQLEARVRLLRNGTIERDMLDEQARYHLNLLQDDEITIMKTSGSN